MQDQKNPAGGTLFGASPDPVMTVGKYAGKRVSTLPLSYCRWIIMQKFAPDIVAAAMKKVRASHFNNSPLNVSRHAVDMFSVRFMDYFMDRTDKRMGIASFLVEFAEAAWKTGKDVSKHRHQDDGVVKALDEVCFVFQQSPTYPDYRELITVYPEPTGVRARRTGDWDEARYQEEGFERFADEYPQPD